LWDLGCAIGRERGKTYIYEAFSIRG